MRVNYFLKKTTLFFTFKFSSKNRFWFAIFSAIVLQLIISVAFNGLIKTFYSRIFLFYTYISFTFLLLLGRWSTQKVYNQYLKSKLKQNVHNTYPLSEGGQAIRDLMDRKVIGKNVVVMDWRIMNFDFRMPKS